MSEAAIRKARAYLEERHRRDERHSFVVDPHAQTTAGGRTIIRAQQHYAGIPVFGGDVALHVHRGRVKSLVADAVELAPAGDGTPDIGVVEAVTAAFRHFSGDGDRSVCQVRHASMRGAVPEPSILASFPFPSRPTVLRAGRSASTPSAYLAWWPEDRRMRLVWIIRMPFRALSYLVLVAAEGEEKGRVIFCSRWSSGATCFGNVFSFNHAAGRTRLRFPPQPADFPPLLPHANAQFLRDWISTNESAGNNASTFHGAKEKLLRATIVSGALEFPAAKLPSTEQSLLNAFYFCNFLHDFFLMLGFGEAEGNFQLQNFATTKGGNDRLQVRIFDKKTKELGNMEARADGEPAKLSLHHAPNGEPSAVHADLVIHEYTHGVVHRMVGGRLTTSWLVQQQSQAMDEGWADYFAITLRNHYLGAANLDYGFATWANFNVRSASYAPNVARDFGRLGKKPFDTVNGAGEIFAAALIRFNENLGHKLGDVARGHCIGWRAVIESLRLIQPNPNFLQGRAALTAGIDELRRGNVITAQEATDARRAALEGFAQYGMGRNATSTGASFGGTTSDFNV